MMSLDEPKAAPMPEQAKCTGDCPIDKRKTCYNCPDRYVGCRTTCDGWAYREQLKLERYKAKGIEYAAYHKLRYNAEAVKRKV